MQSLVSYLNPELLDRARALHQLTLSVRSRLPMPLATHCWVSSIDGDTLKLVTDDACWASAIRYQQIEIIKFINAEFKGTLNQNLSYLKIRVIQTLDGSESPTNKVARYIRNQSSKVIEKQRLKKYFSESALSKD